MSRSVPRLVTDPAQISAEGDVARARGERIVLVPTMGALHAGHVALLDEGRQRGDRLVLSIFVNPTQFGPKEDLAKYPRPVEADLEKAALAGVDVVFMPTAAAMYPAGYQTFVEVRELQQGLCGEVRPGHFVGVATVVCKLFTIVRPHLAVFGEKDFQQLAVITRMTADLNLGVQILPWPTVREPDGLAMSSRNAYLSPSERARAVALSQGLRAAESAAAAGERSATSLIKVAHSIIAPAVDRIDYLELRDAANLAPLSSLSVDGVILVAAFIGTTRLIDNLRLRPTPSHTE